MAKRKPPRRKPKVRRRTPVSRKSRPREGLAAISDVGRLKAVLDAIPGYVSWISSDLRYLGANKALCDSLGLSEREIIGREVGYSDQNEFFYRFVQHFFATDDPRFSHEMTLEFTAGARSFLLVGNKYDGGKEAVILGFDVTEIKRKEEIILAQEQRIISAARMAALGEMAGGIAHEINNPLTIILGYAELLEEITKSGGADASTLLGIAEKVKATTMRIGKIVKGLKSIMRSGEGEKFQVVDLKAVLEETLEISRERFRRYGIEFRVAPIPEPLGVECRPTQISQAVLNLLNNAIDEVMKLPGEKWVAVDVLDRGEEIEIRVTDSGKGIPADVRERIFEPFFTTKPIGKGTGLGLNLSRGFIEGHRGDLSIDPASGNTSFVIRFPKRQPATGVSPHPVLVVDDEQAIVAYCAAVLKKAGYSVLTATSGQMAFELLKDRYVKLGRLNVAAVLTDCQMQEGDGFHLHADIRTSPFREVPVVYMTGAFDVEEIRKIAKTTPAGVLRKPFREDALLRIIREATALSGGYSASVK